MTSRDRIRFVPNLEPHEPGDNCWIWHCWSHDVDERLIVPYKRCRECGHRFRTERQLRRDHQANMRELRDIWWRRYLRMWLAATTTASRIRFCPHCAHDF